MNEILERINIKNRTLSVLLPIEIDDHVVSILREELDRQMSRQRIDSIIFDFAKTEFMDSSGIGMILGRFKKMQFMKGAVSVINVNKRIAMTMELSGLHKIIKIEKGRMV